MGNISCNQTWRAGSSARHMGAYGMSTRGEGRQRLASLRVLLFDDDFRSRGSLRDALRAAGIVRITEANCASSSSEAGFGIPAQIGVIFSEVRLRNGNGLALLKAVRMGRLHPLKPDACFVLFTAHVDDALVKIAADLDASGLVLKPATPEQVRKAILRGQAKTFAPDPEKYRTVETAVAGYGFGVRAAD